MTSRSIGGWRDMERRKIDLLKQQLKQQNKEIQRKKNMEQANLFINTIHSSDTQLVCNTISLGWWL